jgi:hypothetical protein
LISVSVEFALLVLQRPDLVCDRIHLQAVDVTGNLISLLDVAVAVVFNDRAGTRQARRVGAVGVGHPHVVAGESD